jgi:hypothetical protein
MSCGWYNGRKVLDLTEKITAKASKAVKAEAKK